jgi:predicted AAA+ superfamily ATPase
MISRKILQDIENTKKSVLLLGPRQSGKSTLLKLLKPDLTINLADEEVFLPFASNPAELRSRISAITATKEHSLIMIDEVQRIPSLLNTLQALIDEHGSALKFLLSGSSARKLKRGNANLLPGRLINFNLGPITSSELDYTLDTEKALSIGTLPGIISDVNSKEAKQVLKTYAATYIKEEIQAEALTKDIQGFSRFLKMVGSWSAEILDYSKVASLAQVTRQSVTRYFDILEDTLIFTRLTPFAKSNRIKLIQHPKLYSFDVGVLNGLLENYTVSQDRVGLLFENLIFTQLNTSAQNSQSEYRLSFFNTTQGAEVDFILEINGEVFAIQVKSSTQINKPDNRGFESFQRFYSKPFKRFIFYRGNVSKDFENVSIRPWQIGLKEIGL